MRSFMTIAAGVAAMFVLGCGGSGESTATNGEGGSGGKKLRIGVSVPAADHGWTAGVIWWAKKEIEKHADIEWTFETAQTPEEQINDIETMMVKGIDSLVILATESAPLTPIAKRVHDRGIFIVNVDRGFLEPVADVFIEGDNKAFGRKSAEYMAQKLGGAGKILVLEGIPSTVNTARVESFREVMKANPGIQILDSQSGMWNRQKAHEVTQALLVKHKQVDAIWASDDDMALGVEQALKEANRTGVWILGGAGMKDIVKRVMDKDPLFPADITYPPSMIVKGIETASAELKSGAKRTAPFKQRHVLLDVEVITPENAKDFYFPDSVY
jgi:ribose transport system substrate-binding protein